MQTKSLRYRACLSTGLTVIYIDLSAAFICCAFDVRLVGVIFASSYGDLVNVYLFPVSIRATQPLESRSRISAACVPYGWQAYL